METTQFNGNDLSILLTTYKKQEILKQMMKFYTTYFSKKFLHILFPMYLNGKKCQMGPLDPMSLAIQMQSQLMN